MTLGTLGLNSNIQPQAAYQMPQTQAASYTQPYSQPLEQAQTGMPYKEPNNIQFSPQMAPATQIQALQSNQLKQLEELNKLSAQNAYGAQYNMADTNINAKTPNIQNAQVQDTQNPAAQSLSLAGAEDITGKNPDTQNITNQNSVGQNSAGQNSNIQIDETLKNALHAPFDSSLNAQMPAPEIKNDKNSMQNNGQNNETNSTLENNKQDKNYKELPHLNVGVVDGPSKHSKTPVTDSLNRKSIEKPKTKLPAATNKKSFTAGSLSNLCALGAFSIVSILFVPKGISKILKLIKHK